MRYLVPTGLCLATAIAVALTTGSTTPSPAAQKPQDDPVKALLKERLTALQKIHDESLQAYKGGQLPYDQVLSAHLALLNGKLDLCETNTERVKVHEEMVKAAEESVRSVQKRAEARQVSSLDVLKAEVQLLDARIGLEKAKTAK